MRFKKSEGSTMAVIDIKRDGAGKLIFDPPDLQMQTRDADFVFWRNLDSQERHWITAEGKSPNFWFAAPLARFVDGQPADATPQLALTAGDDIVYVCSLHPGEQGKITSSLTTDGGSGRARGNRLGQGAVCRATRRTGWLRPVRSNVSFRPPAEESLP
jgi:hypothetical protein